MGVIRFLCGLPSFAYFVARECYYRAALRHVGHAHRDAGHITSELLHSQRRVNDFLREIV